MNNELITASTVFPTQLLVYPLEQKPLFPGMITQIMTDKKPLMQIIDLAMEKNKYMGVVLTQDNSQEDPYRFSNLYEYGVVVKIHKKIHLPDGGYNVFMVALERFKIVNVISVTQPLIAKVKYLPDKVEKDMELVALTRSLMAEIKSIVENNPLFSEEARLNMVNIDQPGQIADFISAILDLKKEEQEEILEITDLHQRAIRVLTFINREKELMGIQKRIQNQINDQIDKHRRTHFLKEMMQEIKKELGEPVDGKTATTQTFREKLKALSLPEDTHTHIQKEIDKFEILDSHNPEYGIMLGYLEKIFDLPWKDPEKKAINIKEASIILDNDHYGLAKVKKRIIEHLAITKMKNAQSKSIICLEGPPGVGKTSIARSIARALNKKLYHFSVGGMRDEAEIKGHRRTYIGAMPGKIIQGLLYVKEKDPVFVIDEIDKLGNRYQGDPSSALLEVLDPIQNTQFRDLYLDVPFDLSKIFFITTANSLHTIPPALLDRMEIIEISGYIDKEKIAIAQQYIVPKSLKKHGLKKRDIKFSPKILRVIAEQYAREAGMRKFEQYIDKVIRTLVTSYIKEEEEKEGKTTSVKKEQSHTQWPFVVTDKYLEDTLGMAPFRESILNRASLPGTSLGLAWTSMGGDVLVIEAQKYSGNGTLKLTGTLGDVMKESAHIAFTLIKKHQQQFGIPDDFFEKHDVHLHVPQGATPKDGPSAGITMASALLSLLTGKTIRKNFAMTGEVSLVGQVLPIGGLREKIVAARRNNVKNIIMPKSNIADIQEIPTYITKGLIIYPVSHIDEVFTLLFPSFYPKEHLDSIPSLPDLQ